MSKAVYLRNNTILILRETPAAEAWIEQFDPPDKPYASLLLESLELVRTIDLEQAIRGLIDDEVEQVKNGSVAIFAARQFSKANEDEPAEKKCRTPITEVIKATIGDELPTIADTRHPNTYELNKSTSQPKNVNVIPPYFDLDDVEKRPDAVNPGGGVGSEGDIAHLIRDLASRNPGKVHDHPSIHSMRSTKTRLLLLVDDVIASGTRMAAFIRSLTSDKHLKSWYSYKFLKVRSVTYAATHIGLSLVESQKRQNGAKYERLLGQGSALWTDSQRSGIERICRKYAHYTSRASIPLGYKDAFTTIVFEHKCPNTNPAILWAGSKKWKPLFEERPKLGFPTWPIPVVSETHERRILEKIGQTTLAQVNFQSIVEPGARLRILALAVAAKKIRRPEAVASLIGLSIPLAKQLLSECASVGWLTWGYHLTPKGKQELRHARDTGIATVDDETTEKPLIYNSGFYFPKQLRGSRKAT